MKLFDSIKNRRKQRMVSNIKILKDNSNNIEVKEENIAMFPLKIKCSGMYRESSKEVYKKP